MEIYWLAIKISIDNICQVLYNLNILNIFSCVILFNAHKIYTKKKKKILRRHWDKWDLKMCFSGLCHYKTPKESTLRRIYFALHHMILVCMCVRVGMYMSQCMYVDVRGQCKWVSSLFSPLMSQGLTRIVRLGDITEASQWLRFILQQ